MNEWMNEWMRVLWLFCLSEDFFILFDTRFIEADDTQDIIVPQGALNIYIGARAATLNVYVERSSKEVLAGFEFMINRFIDEWLNH